MIRTLDESIAAGTHGVLLFLEVGQALPKEGQYLRDALGQSHRVIRVDVQPDIATLLVQGGSGAYFQRLFRNVRVDATAFQVEDAP